MKEWWLYFVLQRHMVIFKIYLGHCTNRAGVSGYKGGELLLWPQGTCCPGAASAHICLVCSSLSNELAAFQILPCQLACLWRHVGWYNVQVLKGRVVSNTVMRWRRGLYVYHQKTRMAILGLTWLGWPHLYFDCKKIDLIWFFLCSVLPNSVLSSFGNLTAIFIKLKWKRNHFL